MNLFLTWMHLTWMQVMAFANFPLAGLIPQAFVFNPFI